MIVHYIEKLLLTIYTFYVLTVVYSLSPDLSKSSKIPYITGGGLEGRFNFVQIHLHWGSDSSKGEHQIKGILILLYALDEAIVYFVMRNYSIATLLNFT